MSALPDDDELIQACRRGEADAWQQVLDRFERLVFSIPLSYGLTSDDAADIAQTTFTGLLEALDHLRAGTRLAAWLATVARRHTWRLVAQRRREAVGAGGNLAEDEAAGGQANPTERWEQFLWLDQALNRLDELCRELLLGLYFAADQPSYAELAAQLEMPLGSIGPTRARCLERLKQILDAPPEG